eukprot:2049693-Rhodomonas_salina.2
MGCPSCVIGVAIADVLWDRKAPRWTISAKHPNAYVNVYFRTGEDAVWADKNLGSFTVSENPITELGLLSATLSLQRIQSFRYSDDSASGSSSSMKNSDAVFALLIKNLPTELSIILQRELGRPQCGTFFSMKGEWLKEWWKNFSVSFLHFSYADGCLNTLEPLFLGFSTEDWRSAAESSIDGFSSEPQIGLMRNTPLTHNKMLHITHVEMSKRDFMDLSLVRGKILADLISPTLIRQVDGEVV